jgi:hypothetical protein
MSLTHAEQITLDYAGADGLDDVLRNLSGAAVAGRYLWTASDEGRTIECLEPDGSGYRLREQFKLDSPFPKLPGKKENAEADIESLAFSEGALWICGSHCRVRLKTDSEHHLSPEINRRRSRYLLGRVKLTEDGGAFADYGESLPFKGLGRLRRFLAKSDFLQRFIPLPSKENGLDIEGMALGDASTLLLGLRGPLVDSFAVVVEVDVEAKRDRLAIRSKEPMLNFLDLGGLGVRDLARFDDEVLVLAGPVAGAAGPFRIYRWKPSGTSTWAQLPIPLHEWPYDWRASKTAADAAEHPEALCRLDRGRRGLLVLYDNPNQERIHGSRYTADWFAFA